MLANTERVADMLDTVRNGGRPDRMVDYWAESPRDEAEHLHDLLLAGFPDLRVKVDDMLAEQDRVVVRLSFIGTHAGPFHGIPAAGEHVEFGAIRIYQLSDGLVVGTWAHQDSSGLLRQLQS